MASIRCKEGASWDDNRRGQEWFIIDPIKAIADCSAEWFKYYGNLAGTLFVRLARLIVAVASSNHRAI